MTGFSKLNYLKSLRGKQISAPQYRVLVEVFNYTDEYGHDAYPGQKRLAEDTGMSARSVRDHLTWLVNNGYLIKVRRGRGNGLGGGGECTRYRLNTEPESTGESTGVKRQLCVNQPADLRQPTGEISPTIRSIPDHLTDQGPEALTDVRGFTDVHSSAAAAPTVTDVPSPGLSPRNDEADRLDVRRCRVEGCDQPDATFPYPGLCRRHTLEREAERERAQAIRTTRLWEGA